MGEGVPVPLFLPMTTLAFFSKVAFVRIARRMAIDTLARVFRFIGIFLVTLIAADRTVRIL